MKLNGSQIVLEVLKEQEVDTIFGYPGGTILNIFDELYKYGDSIYLQRMSRRLHMLPTVMPEQQVRLACALQHRVPVQLIL